jgi:ATP-dependent helicase/DNAse subunit B
MKLVRGSPGAGKTAFVFREFRQAIEAGRTARIVVPTATLVRHFRHELARDGLVFPPRSVTSFSGFIGELAREGQLVPEGLLRAIARHVLDSSRLPEFASVAGTGGMAETVIDTIALFENAGCTPEKLGSIRKLGSHAKPFERIWRAVRERARQSGFLLRGEWLRMTPVPAEPIAVWFDGFHAFSPIEREFIRRLDASCDITITATDSPAGDEVLTFGLECGAKGILLPGSSRKPATTLITAPALEREADAVARRILALREGGAEFRDIGVAFRDAAAWGSLLRGTFERFGIPARFYFSTPLRRHPAGIFLGGLVSAALEGWEFKSTVTALRAHPAWSTRADFDRFDFAVREALPGRGAANLLACCEADWLKEEIASCLRIESWLSMPQKPPDWQRRVESFAKRVYRPGQLDIAADQTGVETARGHVAALRAWVEAIGSVVPFWNSNEPISLAEFWRVASIATEAAVVRQLDERANVVHVMDVYEARQWNVRTLLVCGVTDSNFPRQRVGNLLFPDDDIRRLYDAGVPLRRAEDHDNEERWLFEALSTRASDSLFLTCSGHDASGKSVHRSRLIDPGLEAEPAMVWRPEPRVSAQGAPLAGRIGALQLHAEMARLHQKLSVTSLEDLAQCRFKFFSGRTLALKSAPERPEERLTARVTGSILHKALERWLANKTRNFVELYEETFDEMCRDEHLPPGYRLEVERIRFREIAERVSARDIWIPDISEAEVELTLELDIAALDTKVDVACRIDRLDTFGSDCVIVDYKSSKPANVEKLVTSHTKLQGPLYALAVREKRNLQTIAMIYWAVREDETYGWGAIPGVDLKLNPIPENWITGAKMRTVERLSGYLTGRVEALPEDAEQCRWCDYQAACRVEEAGLIEIGAAQNA